MFEDTTRTTRNMPYSENKYDYPKKDEEAEITISAADVAPEGPPVPAGHARFYCEKCRTVS